MNHLKQHYDPRDWVLASAREYFILSLLNNKLPRLFKDHLSYAKLTGFGSGIPKLLEGSYEGLNDAFDITIYIDDIPCCFVEVTGVSSARDLRDDCEVGHNYLCVGSWKLKKAIKHDVLKRTWFVFVMMEQKTARFLYANYLHTLVTGEYPGLKVAVLKRKERVSYCLPRERWLQPQKFFSWIANNGLRYVGDRL